MSNHQITMPLRQMRSCLRAHMSAWFFSPRTLLMGLFVLCNTYMLARSYGAILQTYEYAAHIGESLFYHLNMGFNMIMTSTIFLIMVSEIPKRISFQKYMLIRLSRIKWLTSQILFCVTVVLLMFLLVMIFSTLLTLPYTMPGDGWSDLQRLAADPTYLYEPQLTPNYIHSISPLQACLYAGLIILFFWFTMVLVILLFSLMGFANLGLIIYIFMLLLSITVRFEFIPGMKTPLHFSTLSAIASRNPDRELMAVPPILAAYLGIDVALISAMFLRVRNMDLCFSGKE